MAEGASLRLMRRPRWWIGGVIGFTGACLHAVALSFAPLVAVQPISVATLVFAVPLAAFMYGRKPYKAEIFGSIAVAVGLLWLMMLVPHQDVTPRLSDGAALGFIGVITLIALATQVAAARVRGPVRAMLLAIGAGAVTASVSTFVRVVGGRPGGRPRAAGPLVHAGHPGAADLRGGAAAALLRGRLLRHRLRGRAGGRPDHVGDGSARCCSASRCRPARPPRSPPCARRR
ncbi:hypothetical protein ACFSTC_08205 [Nonomuraea ferruginea]